MRKNPTHTELILSLTSSLNEAQTEFCSTHEESYEQKRKSIRQSTMSRIERLRNKISKVVNEETKSLAKADKRFEKEKQKFKKDWSILDNHLAVLRREMSLFNIKNNIKPKNELHHLDKNLWEKAEFKSCKMLKLAAIHSIIAPAYNEYSRKKNKYDVQIKVVCFNDLFKKMCDNQNLIHWDNILGAEKVPNVEEGQEWLNRHYEKLTEAFIKFHDEVVFDMEKVNLNPAKEFDFRIFDMRYSRRSILKKTKNELIVEQEEISINKTIVSIKHLGNLIFQAKVKRPPLKDQIFENRKKTNEQIVLEFLNWHHPLGLTKDQVKIKLLK